jgi:hypothetical protein
MSPMDRNWEDRPPGDDNLPPPRESFVSRGWMMALIVGAVIVAVVFLLTSCGRSTAVSPVGNTQVSPTCETARQWQTGGGTGELAEMTAGMSAILGDLNTGDQTTLQADGLAMMEITGMDVVSDAPPVLTGKWATMVLDLNKAGNDLVGGDTATARTLVLGAVKSAAQIGSGLHAQCGI